jgi:hypothetical protein
VSRLAAAGALAATSQHRARAAPEEVASGGEADDRVDAGWGPALAPAGFGMFFNDLPAGNFRDQRH